MNVRHPSAVLLYKFADMALVKLITSFLLSYPLAGVLKRIPDARPYQKNLFIIAWVNPSLFPFQYMSALLIGFKGFTFLSRWSIRSLVGHTNIVH